MLFLCPENYYDIAKKFVQSLNSLRYVSENKWYCSEVVQEPCVDYHIHRVLAEKFSFIMEIEYPEIALCLKQFQYREKIIQELKVILS